MDNFYVISLIKTGLIAFVFLTVLAYLQWVERKVLAHIQLRPGPYRVGPHGLLQPLADVIKLLTKEGFIPSNVNTFFYLLAPFLAVTIALIAISVIPFGPEIEIFGVRDVHAVDGSEDRYPVHPGAFLDRRLRRSACRVGLEQQIRSARRIAQSPRR